MVNHYQTLEVGRGASKDEIKSAWRRLTKLWHPDKNKSAGAEAKYKLIAIAYEVLTDESKRGEHNRELEAEEFRGAFIPPSVNEQYQSWKPSPQPRQRGRRQPPRQQQPRRQGPGADFEDIPEEYMPDDPLNKFFGI